MGLPRVGILADDRLQQHLLKSALVHFGFDVVVNADPQRMDLLNFDQLELDAWLIDLQDEDEEHFHWLDRLLDSDTPVLMGFARAPHKNCPTFPKWEKRLYSKLREMVHATPVVAEDVAVLDKLTTSFDAGKLSLPAIFQDKNFSGQVAAQVWVLGASLGGPGAVKSFLDALPGGLPVAFIYAQHIDPRFEQTLATTIGRHADYEMRRFSEGDALRCGEILVAPIENEFSFVEGRLHDHHTGWPGPYGPSIDQVILNVHSCYGERAGYILFSGMGNDGAEAIVGLPDEQLKIWAQLPQSCANSSMPESAIETGRVRYSGDPQQLALQLVNHIKNTWVDNNESISD
ncbi:chemotaxis protein CheB [Bacterioplanoides pacificum]|uniref:protein-glutamate methylesterase n=1 Tax=Bacterioplanoides pacificum TaxID=1171596 RepID=A0ABV7VTR9_9GAMM